MDDRRLFLDVARCYADQSTCLRRHYGAVIVDPTMRIQISGGFNGACRGISHCEDCIRIKLNIPHNTDYLTCFSLHSEQNALIQAGKQAWNSDMYIYGYDVVEQCEIVDPMPCFFCTKMIINAGIRRIITNNTIYDPYKLHEYYVSRF